MRTPILFVSVAILAACTFEPPPPPADLVMLNGSIYTVNPAQPWAEAVAVQDGRILAVGDNSLIGELIGPETRVIELQDRMVLPGFVDSHSHPVGAGYALLGCDLREQESLESLLEHLRGCAAAQPEGWLEADGYDITLMPGHVPNKALLDEIFPDRPVYAESDDGHSGWVNSAGLEAAGINGQTPDPHGGEIDRDAEGQATGVLWDAAMNLAYPFLREKTLERDIEALRVAQDHLLALGITSMMDVSYTDRNWAAWQAMERAGVLKMRVGSSLVKGVFANYPEGRFEALFADRATFESDLLSTNSVKLFLDGVLEAHSGALLEPYLLDEPHSGVLNFTPDELNALVTQLDAMDVQVHMHAIGDRGVRTGLDAVEAARRANGPRDNRHHITHLQLIHPDDYARFAELDVTANFQALWAYPDTWITEMNLPVVGQERVDRMYPIGAVHRLGGRIAGSSDWAVSPANPLYAIEVAVRRQDPELENGPVLNEDNRVDLATMIEAYTVNGAWLLFNEASTGSIEAGKFADLVVLDRNLFEIPATQLDQARVLMTLFEGEVVYESQKGDD